MCEHKEASGGGSVESHLGRNLDRRPEQKGGWRKQVRAFVYRQFLKLFFFNLGDN